MTAKADDESREPAEESGREIALVYEPNPKHKDPWQPGRRGSLCEAEVRPQAQDLLETSILWEDGRRYAVYEGMAYCAQESGGKWHGYPVGWREVPQKLALRLRREGLVSKRQLDRFWRSH